LPPKTEMRERLKMGADGGEMTWSSEHAAAAGDAVRTTTIYSP
jgi:hypothetical protein